MFDNPLIPPEQHWALLAILVAVAAFGLWAEKTRWGQKLSAVVIAILGTFVLSNIGLIPSAAPVYDVVWSYLVPLAIPLLLFQANLKRIVREAGPTLIAFTAGGVGTVVGTVLAFWTIPLGPEGWKLAAIFCSTYVGGSMNYVAASEAVQLKSADLLAAGVAADNLVMTLYFLLLFALPSITWLRKRYPKRDTPAPTSGDRPAGEDGEAGEDLSLLNMGMALAIGTGICALGFWLGDLVGIKGTGILFITALIVALATLFPSQLNRITGADRIGTFLMQIFFATIGASANIVIVVTVGPILFAFAGLILFVHLIFILLAGWIFRLDLSEIVIASNANMGGPTTAAAMAVARNWRTLVIPAILCGTLGYAVATFVGVGVGYWLAPG